MGNVGAMRNRSHVPTIAATNRELATRTPPVYSECCDIRRPASATGPQGMNSAPGKRE